MVADNMTENYERLKYRVALGNTITMDYKLENGILTILR